MVHDPNKNPSNFGTDPDFSTFLNILGLIKVELNESDRFRGLISLSLCIWCGLNLTWCHEGTAGPRWRNALHWVTLVFFSFRHWNTLKCRNEVRWRSDPRMFWLSWIGLNHSTPQLGCIILSSSRLWQFVCWTNYEYDMKTTSVLTELPPRAPGAAGVCSSRIKSAVFVGSSDPVNAQLPHYCRIVLKVMDLWLEPGPQPSHVRQR